MKVLQGRSGFTLIEILIATVIITIASLGIVTLTVGVMRGNSISKRMTAATTLVQDRLEEVKRLGYSNAEIAEGTQNYGSIENFAGYKSVVSVSKDDPSYKMKTIHVTVSWNAVKPPVEASTILSE